MITNQNVYDALVKCIKEKWKPLTKNPSRVEGPCALCKLFGGCNDFDPLTSKYIPGNECKACPLYLTNGHKGCADGSAYNNWEKRSKKTAKAMLNELKVARKHFFGDWK